MGEKLRLAMGEKRIEFLDLVKGVAIFLVVFGHTIQYGSGESFLLKKLFFSDEVFKVIYSFHMPIFMLVSGFLFYNSHDKKFVKIFMLKLKSLILPILIW